MESKREAIAQGSKSFFLASLFFNERLREDSWTLYRWCRYCDDEIDKVAPEHAPRQFEKIRLQTQRSLELSPPENPLFEDLSELVQRTHLPSRYPLDLLAGFRMDVEKFSPKNYEELLLYCYRVAGVVGVMMVYIMEVSHPKAFKNAVDLGIAMQLTNIARDVQEDFLNGRRYLPQSWLDEHSLESDKLFELQSRTKLFAVVTRLLREAEKHYRSGLQGLEFLPLRCALTISIAAAIYSSIGRKIMKIGPDALTTRTVISLPEKIFWTAYGAFRIIPLALRRVRFPWKSISLKNMEPAYEYRQDLP